MRTWLMVALVLAVGLAGCGDKKDIGDEGQEFKTPPKNDDDRYVITIEDNDISPRNAKVPNGAVVVWEVNINGCHIKAKDGAFDSSKSSGEGGVTFNNGVVPRGGTYTWTAVEKGEHDYWCNGKSDVDGTLRVG